ncbi:farnesyl diphosphate synthase [Blochmannia endosymbiont of Camponotus (Colobopsis) obliquus]|nr:farnesyl diphosphate synthase [Blochmannia endosymbiont of Camponotus (Colobopsis) obliquus]
MNNITHEMQISYRQVNNALERYLKKLPHQNTLLIEAMKYSALLGGKKIRPFLVYQTGKLFGLIPNHLDAPAAAIECIHAYSLIHDDLPSMDNDTLRRGHPTCHIKFNESTAILAGDALHSLAFSILTENNTMSTTIDNQYRLKMIATLAAACGANGMCFGQFLDITAKNQKISYNYLKNIHFYKTSILIRAAVRLGALAAGKTINHKILKLLDHYATSIGLAFQIQDDILDIVNDKHCDNKQQKNTKKKNNKNTYSTKLGLNIARNKAKNLYYKSLSSLKHINKLGYNTTILSKLARYIIERDQ